MPRSHIHGSPRRFHIRSNLTDDPGNATFRKPIHVRMHNGVATGFDVSTKDKIGKESSGDMIDTVCNGTPRVNTGMTRLNTKRHVSRRVHCGRRTVCNGASERLVWIRRV